nr:hypothetical protein [Clostridium tyrobutyricum]
MAEVKMHITENMDAQNKYLIGNGKQNSLKILTSNCLQPVKILNSVLPAIKSILISTIYFIKTEKR